MKVCKYTFFLFFILFLINSGSAQNYCIPTCYNGGPYKGIRSFQVNSLVNYHSSTADNGYILYPESEFTTTMTIGQSYPLQILSSYVNYEYFSVWIDLDSDFNFEPNELLYQQSGNGSSVSTTITIPNNPAFTGLKRLRVMNGQDSFWACGWPQYPGEAEDYTVHITDSLVPASYCIPMYDMSGSYLIEHFRLNDLYNCASGGNPLGYTLYPDSVYTTSLQLGKTYPFLIDRGTSAGVSCTFTMYIDYDNDLAFEFNERIANQQHATSYHGNYTVPDDSSLIGQHRIRVLAAILPNSNYLYPCGDENYGEAEDYIINIIPAVADTDTIVPPPANRWERIYDLPYNQWGQVINETYDGGYLVLGVTGGQYTPYQLKLSMDGDTLWSRSYPSSYTTYPNGTDTTSDGGSVICGYRDGGSFMMKNNACGDTEWLYTYGPADYNEMWDVYQAKDGNFIASTRYFSDSVTNYVNRFGLALVDTLGVLKWSKNYSKYYSAEIGRMMVTSDSGYLINSYAYFPVPGDPYYYVRSVMIKTNSKGDVLWESVYDTINNVMCYTHVSAEIPGKGYISLGGIADTITSDFDLSVFFTDYSGTTQWHKTVANDGFNVYAPTDIMMLNDSTIVILADKFNWCDSYDYRIALFTVDTAGNVINSTSFGDSPSKTGSLCRTSNGKFMVVSTNHPYDPASSIYAIKFNADLTMDTIYGSNISYDSICAAITPVKKTTKPGDTRVSIYPNPASGFVSIHVDKENSLKYSVTICNSFGIPVMIIPDSSSERQEINLGNLSPGLYIISVNINGNKHNEKLVVY